MPDRIAIGIAGLMSELLGPLAPIMDFLNDARDTSTSAGKATALRSLVNSALAHWTPVHGHQGSLGIRCRAATRSLEGGEMAMLTAALAHFVEQTPAIG